MEDLTPPVQTVEQPKASPGAEEVAVDPILKSPSARRSAEESAAATGELGGGKELAPMVDGSATVPGAIAEAAGSSRAKARVADTAPESGVKKPVMLEQQTALPKASEGMVRHAIRPSSPLVVLPAAKEEDEVEEIECEESRP